MSVVGNQGGSTLTLGGGGHWSTGQVELTRRKVSHSKHIRPQKWAVQKQKREKQNYSLEQNFLKVVNAWKQGQFLIVQQHSLVKWSFILAWTTCPKETKKITSSRDIYTLLWSNKEGLKFSAAFSQKRFPLRFLREVYHATFLLQEPSGLSCSWLLMTWRTVLGHIQPFIARETQIPTRSAKRTALWEWLSRAFGVTCETGRILRHSSWMTHSLQSSPNT